MSEALRFALALSTSETLRRTDDDLVVDIGVAATHTRHEWRICDSCGTSALVKSKAKSLTCRIGHRCDGHLVSAIEYARRPGHLGIGCARAHCPHPARHRLADGRGLCDICASPLTQENR